VTRGLQPRSGCWRPSQGSGLALNLALSLSLNLTLSLFLSPSLTPPASPRKIVSSVPLNNSDNPC